jgi:glycosyltransferase involved in cell wall biosynthesis
VRWFYIALERFIAPLSTKLIFVSESNREEARALGIGTPSQYELIRSGVPIAAIKSAGQSANRSVLRKELGIPTEAPLVTTIGPFKPQKNLPDFIRAAAEIHRANPAVHFLIVGDGALRPALEKHVRDAGLENHLHMPGWRRDAAAILAVSDVFAMTSLWEGLPRSLVEAQILAVPSVCYDTDGVRDVLSKGGGTIVPQGAVSQLAQAVIAAIKTGPSRTSAAIGIEFDIDQMVRQQETLYKSLLAL